MPGPLPSYRPDFPPDLLDRAREVVRQRTVRYPLRQRAELVLLLHREPTLPNTEAAARVRLHPNSVRAWRRRWAAGDFALEDAAGRGRKASFSPPR
jgi:transposase